MVRIRGETTKLVKVKAKSDSLRTTIPSFIVKVMNLSEGDLLSWKIESLTETLITVKVVRDKDMSIKKEYTVKGE